jgi:hypothetical protein
VRAPAGFRAQIESAVEHLCSLPHALDAKGLGTDLGWLETHADLEVRSHPARLTCNDSINGRVSVLRASFWHHSGKRELTTHDSACVEVVLASSLAQFVERDVTFGVAWKNE